MKIIFTIIFVIVAGTLHPQDVKKIKITDLEKTMAESKTPLIVSFWATFCLPCLEEIPHLQDVVKNYNATDSSTEDIQLLLVSLDLEEYYPKKLKDFARKRKFTASILWLDEFNADYFCPKVDSAWSGAIPATLMINNKTGSRQFFEEQLSREKIETAILSLVIKN